MRLRCNYCDSYARDHGSFQVSTCPHNISMYSRERKERPEYNHNNYNSYYIQNSYDELKNDVVCCKIIPGILFLTFLYIRIFT